MSFEAPVQPIPARRGRVIGALVVIVAVLGLLVWMPWSASPVVPPSFPAGSVVANATTSPPAPATSTLSPTPYVPPVGAPERAYLPFVQAPTLDLFRPRWSVVGVRDEADSPLDVTQVPISTTSGFIEGASADGICQVAVLGSALVAVLPAHTLRLIGIAAPAGEITSPIEVTRVDGTVVSDYDLLVWPPADGTPARSSARVFVQSDLQRWSAGAYRFHMEAPDGTPRFAYACLVPPALLDGADVAQGGP